MRVCMGACVCCVRSVSVRYVNCVGVCCVKV